MAIYEIDEWWKKYTTKKKRSEKYKSSLGWSKESLSKTTSYKPVHFSLPYISSISEKEIDETSKVLNKAIKSTKDLIIVLNFPFKINILLSDNDEDCNSSSDQKKRILFIPTKVIDDSNYSTDEKINIMCGLGVHEATHLMYTKYEIINQFKKSSLATSSENKEKYIFIYTIFNILEDERVEDLLLKERPGFLDFIEEAKKYNFERYNQFFGCLEKNLYESFLDTLIKLIRFQDKLTNEREYNEYRDRISKNKEIFDKIQNILSELPKNTKESLTISYDIYTIIEDNLSKEDLTTFNKGCYDKKIFYRLFGDVISGVDTDNPDEIYLRNSEISSKIRDNPIISKLALGIAEKGETENSYFTKISGNKEQYLSDFKKIKHLIPNIKKIINQIDKNYTFNIYGCRSGLLDTNKLAEAYQGVPQVYIKQGEVKTNKTTLCILLDESGSMCCKDKYITARRAAILLNEAFGKLPGVDLYIYGHTADTINDSSVEIDIFREGNKYISKYSLSEVEAKNENRDGPAIYEVAKRVRKFTNEKCIMFVISDGSPCAGRYYGSEARRDVRDNVKKVENLGFNVIQVGIDEIDFVNEMFTSYIDISKDLSKLPKKLGDIIKKAVINDKKTEII